MAELTVIRWRDIPAQVTAKEGRTAARRQLPDRFQEAIDEAAMKQGMAGSDAYLEQWRHGDWLEQPGSPDEVVAAVAERLDVEYGEARLTDLLEA